MEFPRFRYRQAGATDAEVDELQARFEDLPAGGQETRLAQLAGASAYELQDDIAQLRAKQRPAAALTFSDGSSIGGEAHEGNAED